MFRKISAVERGADCSTASKPTVLTEALLARGETGVTLRPGGPVRERVGPLLLHLFQHQIHHRGQAHTMIGDAGIAPPQLDDFHLDFGRAPSAQARLEPGGGAPQ